MTDLWEHIDLCSGVGGFSLGFQYAKLSEPILFCEIDEYCQKVLKKHWPNVPICNDVKELADDTTKFIPRSNGRKRILTAGYPCQPFSVAGQKRGTEDPRHIWPWILRIIQQERPDVCVFENVSGHISLGLDEVLHDLEGESYTTRTFVFGAEAVGAPHKRNRLWIIARNVGNAQGDRKGKPGNINQKEGIERSTASQSSCPGADVADTKRMGWEQGAKEQGEFINKEAPDQSDHGSQGCSRLQSGGNTQQRLGRNILDGLSPWLDEPVDIPRVASGQKDRTHRLKALGNAIVPAIAQRIGIAIRESF